MRNVRWPWRGGMGRQRRNVEGRGTSSTHLPMPGSSPSFREKRRSPRPSKRCCPAGASVGSRCWRTGEPGWR